MNIAKSQIVQLIDIYKLQKRTPFVVEVLGTPNSGKTTAIQTFEKIAKHYNIKCKIIYEAAARCRIKNKLSPEFNLWTLNETVKQLLEAYTGNYDIIVCERGLLDTICWCNLYYQENLMSIEEYHKIVDYILLKRLINKVNCVYIMKCSVETSLCRENLSGILEVKGTIVNEMVLTKYNASLERVENEFRKHFEKIVTVDTTKLAQPEINRMFLLEVFESVKTLCE